MKKYICKIGSLCTLSVMGSLFLLSPVSAQSFLLIDRPGEVKKPVPAWKKDFNKTYGLAHDEILKHVSAPYPPSRTDYMKSFLGDSIDPKMDMNKIVMFYQWDGVDCENKMMTMYSDSMRLPLLIECMGFQNYEVEYTKDVNKKQISGEFVIRAGAPREKVIARFEQILRNNLQIPIRLTIKKVERDVTIVGGKYDSKPLEGRQGDQIDLFAVKRDENSGAGGGSGTFDEFLTATGSHIKRHIIYELPKKPKGTITWFYHNSTIVLRGPDPNMDPDGVLKNVTAQTGLTFKIEKRKVEVLFVEME